MYLEFLLEEQSSRVLLEQLLAQRLDPRHLVRFHVFQGKRDLLSKLPGLLRGYAHLRDDDWRIIVLVDRDNDDCLQLKARLEETVSAVGLALLSDLGRPECPLVIPRIAIEELEAWLLGDPQALCTAFPRVPESYARRSTYRDPDAVRGGTWEALHRLLRDSGYTSSSYPKIQVARTVSAHMCPEQNRSHSFQVFWRALEDLMI